MSMNISSVCPNTRSRGWYSKVTEYLHRKNRIDPGQVEIPGSEFFQLNPHRVLRIIRPELKSARFYEPQINNDRPESLNDNFYSRWARRPHPSDNCRCSFRQSANSSRLSSHEEKFISQEIARIRSSLCEAEKSGKNIEELEKSIVLDLKQLGEPEDEHDSKDSTREVLQEHCNLQTRIEPLDDLVKKRIVQDLDRYISDLLDEILDDTIKAIAQSDTPFGHNNKQNIQNDQRISTFDISFAFHEKQNENDGQTNVPKDKPDEDVKGYVNQGFVGSASDPETLDFHLRHRINNDGILENPDCVDSGINSVETIELQQEQDQNLEQSLIDIIDAKLGGTSIGKSLEDLGMEIDETDEARIPKQSESMDQEVPVANLKSQSQQTIPN